MRSPLVKKCEHSRYSGSGTRTPLVLVREPPARRTFSEPGYIGPVVQAPRICWTNQGSEVSSRAKARLIMFGRTSAVFTALLFLSIFGGPLIPRANAQINAIYL